MAFGRTRRATTVEAVPVLAPRRAIRASDLHVLGILDPMSLTCFGAECTVSAPPRDAWADALLERPVDLVLVESAWKGNGGSWEYRVGSYGREDVRGLPDLRNLVATARERGVPTVFWNKEDPVHHDKFKEAAGLFDVVLTTDDAMVPRYLELGAPVRHSETLQFAAQPSLHNPVTGEASRIAAAAFAGSFYRNRHHERQAPLRMLLEAAQPFGLDIYDRMFDSGSDGFGFPDSVAANVRGALPYDEVVRAYKRYRVFLNVNSVTSSATMFSRRVFELLACGTPVVSTPSVGMSALFGDLVPVVTDPDSATAAIRQLLEDDEHWAQASAAGVRRVMGAHTYAHRLAQIGRAVGIDVEVPAPDVAPVTGLDRATARAVGASWLLLGACEETPQAQDLVTATAYVDADVISTREPDDAAAGGGAHAYGSGGAVAVGGPVLVRRALVADRGWPATADVPETFATWFREGVRFYAL